MTIKTYPLQFTEEHLNQIKEVATESGMTIKAFILMAIEEKIKSTKK